MPQNTSQRWTTVAAMAALLLSSFSSINRARAQGLTPPRGSRAGVEQVRANVCVWVWDGQGWVKECY